MTMTTAEALRKYKIIAVVGASRNPGKDAYRIPEYMQRNGYRIIPVNPFADEILGEKCYPSLSDLPDELKTVIDIVDIFRPSEDVAPIVEEAIEMKKQFGRPYVIWMQLGIGDEEAAGKARRAGIEVFQDKCLKVEHRRI